MALFMDDIHPRPGDPFAFPLGPQEATRTADLRVIGILQFMARYFPPAVRRSFIFEPPETGSDAFVSSDSAEARAQGAQLQKLFMAVRTLAELAAYVDGAEIGLEDNEQDGFRLRWLITAALEEAGLLVDAVRMYGQTVHPGLYDLESVLFATNWRLVPTDKLLAEHPHSQPAPAT